MATMSRLKRKIEGLSNVDFTLPSEVDVAMDELASALIDEFEVDENGDLSWGRTPSLFEVIEELVDKGKVQGDAVGWCQEIRDLLKEAYDGELDDDDSEAVEGAIEKLQKLLVEACKGE